MNVKKAHYLTPLALTVLIAAALACDAGQQATEAPASDDQVATAVAQTLEAVPTATVPEVGDVQTNTPEPKPTDTPSPTNTPGASGCSDDSKFIADVNFPDNAPVTPGQTFTKIWRIQNNGSCTWTTAYQLVFISGEQMGAPQGVRLSHDVPPGESYEVSVTLTAPTTPGTYRSRWQLSTPDGALFGDRPYVQIVVPTEEPAVVDLREEIFFVAGGGFDYHCFPGVPIPPEEQLPTFTGGKRGELGSNDFGGLCIFGFPFGEIITVELYAPDNNHVSSMAFLIEESADGPIFRQIDPPSEGSARHSARVVSDVTYIELLKWWPVGLPPGEWRAVVSSASAYAEGPFEVGPHYGPYVSTIPDADINPFEIHHCDEYSAGEKVIIRGTKFEPNKDLPLGIYHQTYNTMGKVVVSLFRSEIVATDHLGNFSTAVIIEASDLSETYYVVAVTDLQKEVYSLNHTACFIVE